jgi:hypothetical protein
VQRQINNGDVGYLFKSLRENCNKLFALYQGTTFSRALKALEKIGALAPAPFPLGSDTDVAMAGAKESA